MGRLTYQFELIEAIRFFFKDQGFNDVITPPLVENPGMETHIHPLQVYHAREKKIGQKFLHTSPEFCMKELLAKTDESFDNIFTISYCFRDEPSSDIHRSQFLMLEWYRKNAFYTQIMEDCEALIKHLGHNLNAKNQIEHFQRVTISDLFKDILKFDILNFLDRNELRDKIKSDFKEVILPEAQCSWDDYYFLLFLNLIEPTLKNHPYILLYEYPAPLAALSTLKKEDPRVCERFEIYMDGIELCNAFNELTDYNELKIRFENQKAEKKELYNYDLPWPENFMNVMKNGYPKSSGIALGVERLLKVLQRIENPFYF